MIKAPYNDRAGFVAGSDTSEEAADSIEHRRPTMQRQLLELFNETPAAGLTCWEVESMTDWAHQSASARLRELVLLGSIEDSGRRRLGKTGRKQRVYVLKETA